MSVDDKCDDLSASDDEEFRGFSESFQTQTGVINRPEPKDPRPKYNLISWLFFFWIEPLLWLGFRKGITQDDLYAHPHEVDSQKLLNRFNRFWQRELSRKKEGKKPRLLLTMLRCLLWPFLLQGLVFFIEIALLVGQSIILGYFTGLLTISEPTDEDARNAYLFALGLIMCGVVVTFIHGHNFLLAYKLGMTSRIIMTGVVYQKITSLSQVTIGKISIGHIVNLASNDVQRFDLAFLFLHIIWIAPIHLAVVTYLVYVEVGWSAFVVTGFVVVQVPLQILLAKIFARFRFKSALVTDKRIRIMNEVITGVKVIKMYAWEHAFKSVVSKLRRLETIIIFKGGLVRAFGLAFMIVSITMMSFVLFSVFAGTGGVLTPKNVFTTLSLLIILRLTTVHFVVQNVLAMSEGHVAISRIQELLDIEDFDSIDGPKIETEDVGSSPSADVSVTVDNLSASWTDNEATGVLQNISFRVTKDSPLLAVVGTVGAGKSTLLQCVLSELQSTEGTVKINGRISYTSQEPWLFSASLRDNVLFGNPYDPDRYNTVIEACALNKDIHQLVNGDLTLVGERGVTLSGGQKARVSLARAVYHKADIYLLDDPLSAVDVAVAKHLFKRCIRGVLKDSLVVLVTHQVQFALQCDQILGLKEGKVEVYGEINEMLSQSVNLKQLLGLLENEDEKKREEDLPLSFTSPVHEAGLNGSGTPTSPLAVHYHKSELNPQIIIEEYPITNGALTSHNALPATPSSTRRDPLKVPVDPDGNFYPTNDCEPSIFSSPSLYSLHSEVGGRHDKFKEEVQVMLQPPEEKNHGSLSYKTYISYFRAGGSLLALLLMIVSFVIAEGSLVVSDWWISDWAQCAQVNGSSTTNRSTCLLTTEERIAGFAGATVGTVVLNFVKTILFYAICVNASRVLHNRMFASILRTPMLFFDTNPIGRVLNRFSKDVGFLDDLLPYIFCEYVLLFFRVCSILITAIVAIPWISIPCALMVVVFMCLRWYYLKTSRELKRLEALARSPVYSHISTTLQGLPIIRSFGKKDVAVEQFHSYQNEHTRCYYLYLVTTRWLGIRMDSLSNMFLAIVAFSAFPLASVFDPALIGLALTYTLSLTGMFQYVVRQSAEVDNIMISSERVIEYSKLEDEASLETVPASKKPASDWPNEGTVKLENVTFRYSTDLPLVLNNLNVEIHPAEKVGVVGRTGAGKSSLLSVLFRLAEPSGQITIDDVDIQTIGLHDLRSKMSIIPQDPVLFSGTMRYNLDPFDEFLDSDLWDVLEQVQLKVAVEQLEGQLGGEVSEGGSNFSVGQKQLVCLARALMRKNRILILDEATANVDIRTDEIIQQAIREKFTECTVITIAHRLNTIMDSDRILVLCNGEVREFDTPHSLLEDTNSLFTEMVTKTGLATSRKLREIALNSSLKKR